MSKIYYLLALVCTTLSLCGQTESTQKADLLIDKCSYEPEAEYMVLRDDAQLSVNNDYSLRLERNLTIKLFKDKKLDDNIERIIFYPSASYERYYKLSFKVISLESVSKSPLPKDYTDKLNSTHITQYGIKAKKGELIEVSYAINFQYDEKIPDWRFQFNCPTDRSSIKLSIPEWVTMRETLEGGYDADVTTTNEVTRPVRLHNQTQTLKVSERFYQLSQLPSHRPAPFDDNSPRHTARLHFHVLSIIKDGKEINKESEKQIERIVESLSTRVDFLLRLGPSFELKMDYDRRIKSLTDKEERLARIYDLVRRHLTWTGVDSLSAPRPLAKVWADKKGNSTEINLVLVKLLEMYGYDVSPLIVSTRNNGTVDTSDVTLSDFNRTVACVNMGNRNRVLDATAKYTDYPMMSSAILNTTGLLISMDRNRWVSVRDTSGRYRNSVTLLGHLSGDSSFITNVYVNSTGYAKAEHVDILERDSLKGLRRYFERDDKAIHFKHFIVANEYVDTLPLAQEFDIRVRMEKNDNLYSMVPTWYAIPDTLLSITDRQKTDINFGYKQAYDLVSEFTYPDHYEIYLVPDHAEFTGLGGKLHFEREFHMGGSNFSLRQSLTIDQDYFNAAEAAELGKFIKKVNNTIRQRVILKRLN